MQTEEKTTLEKLEDVPTGTPETTETPANRDAIEAGAEALRRKVAREEAEGKVETMAKDINKAGLAAAGRRKKPKKEEGEKPTRRTLAQARADIEEEIVRVSSRQQTIRQHVMELTIENKAIESTLRSLNNLLEKFS
jgi:hypothetical protein